MKIALSGLVYLPQAWRIDGDGLPSTSSYDLREQRYSRCVALAVTGIKPNCLCRARARGLAKGVLRVPHFRSPFYSRQGETSRMEDFRCRLPMQILFGS